MKKHTHLALLCAIAVIGLLISPVMAVKAAQGEEIYRPFNKAQECPDIDGNLIVWEDDRYDEQERGVKDIFLATVEDIRSTPYGYSFGTRITYDPASQEKPSISGDYIVWQDNRHGNWDIYLYQRSTDKETQLTTDTGKQWLPIVRGNHVAWYDDSSGRTKIVLYDIAARAVKDVIDCDAKTTIPYGSTEFKPALSENYVAWMEEADWKVHHYDIAAGRIIGPVSPGTAIQSWPSLSGSLIAWEDDRHGNPDIYMTNLDDPSGGEKRITFDTGDQVSAAISGTLISWEDKRVPARSIYMYDLSPPGEELSVVDADDIYDEHLYPAVSGNTIVWQRGREADSNLYIFIYEPGAPVEPVLTTIEVEPTAVTLAIDESKQFAATALDQFGDAMTGVNVTWSCSNTTVGTISESSGFFTAHAVGTTSVTASADGLSGTATVTVNAAEPADPAVLTSILVEPTTVTLTVGNTREFTTTALDQFGNELPEVAVTWASSNETVGTVGADGIFTALAEGTATVTATAGDVFGTATVTVSADAPVLTRIEIAPATATLTVGNTHKFATVCSDESGNTMPGVPVVWSCSNETVGTVGADGIFTALAAGTAAVTATADEIAGTATVTVTAADDPAEPVIESLRVTPPRATLAVGDDQKFIVTAYDQDNNVISAGEVTWTSSNETAGTIGADGVLTALAEGTATVTATAGNASTEAVVTVIAVDPALAKIAVSPSAVILEVDDTRAFDVVAFDRFGNVVADAAITWTSSDPGVGTIDVCGLFTAICAGTTTLTATGDGAAGTATVTVTSDDPVLSRIAVTPPAITFNVGDAETFSATAYDQDGCVMPGIDIAWLSSDETVGTIGTDGRFAALTAGTTTLTASACGVTGTATVTVTDASSGVVISPSAVILDVKDSRQFTATAFDTEGNVVPSPAIAWSCDDEVVGTIDRDGLFTAKAEGSATVTATVDGDETGTAVVTVRSASSVPARIAVSPSDFTIAAGSTLSLTATVYDQYGYAMPEVKVTWESSDETVGTIDACGLFTALEDGEVTLTASAGGISGSACVTVDPSLPVPTCVEVDPATATLAAGETREFVATVFDQCDNEMDWVRVAWSSSDPGVGSIDRAGLFAAYAGGSADVKARAGSAEGTAAVTVTGAPAPNPGDPGDSGGSTGSGWSDSGGDSGPTFDAGMRENLMRGETFTFSGITTSSVGSVAITAANTIPKLMVTVKETTPSAATAPPTGDIYEYVEITLSWVNPHDIESAVIVFTIPADWLEDHGMAPEDVRLMRCVGGVWQSLETEVAGEENGLYRFRATTPGFSTFAIAAAPENATVVVETNATTEGETNATTNVTAGVTTEATTAQATTTPAAPLVYAPLLAPLAFFLWLRKKN
ncbi:Ig-like domain-containing protein [Methanoculleus sp.]|uniref:Ig-like domain-containing protein n=1 Tax=Methanoculleus sp. TaxID=90427 RepID=UPI00320E2B8C